MSNPMALDPYAVEAYPQYTEVAQYMLTVAETHRNPWTKKIDSDALAADAASDFALYWWDEYRTYPEDWIAELAVQVAAHCRKEK